MEKPTKSPVLKLAQQKDLVVRGFDDQ